MKITRLIAAITVSASLAIAMAAQAQEETPVAMNDLPSQAQNTVKQKAGNDPIVRVEKENLNGKECYDAVVNRQGKEIGIRVEPNGNLLGIHRETAE